jgi:uncharacterized protein (DUF433 family)
MVVPGACVRDPDGEAVEAECRRAGCEGGHWKNLAHIYQILISNNYEFVKQSLRLANRVCAFIMTCMASELPRITFEPDKSGGRPCIRGYRLRVKDVLDMLVGGASEAEILANYPFLEPADIRACLA